MWNEYAREKLNELDKERAAARARRLNETARVTGAPPRRRLLAPVARLTGSRVRRLGEALETWAAPQQYRRA